MSSQCRYIRWDFYLVTFSKKKSQVKVKGYNNSNSGFQTWFPYEHDRQEYKCKLTCYSRELEEYYQTGENVIDGTRCSYEDEDDICVQGRCVKMGCDMKPDSSFVADECGICGGDGSTCRMKVKERKGNVAANQLTKVMVIPKGARRVSIQVAAGSGLALVVKERDSGLTVYDTKKWAGTMAIDDVESVSYGAFITGGTRLKYSPTGTDEMVYLSLAVTKFYECLAHG